MNAKHISIANVVACQFVFTVHAVVLIIIIIIKLSAERPHRWQYVQYKSYRWQHPAVQTLKEILV